MYMQQVLLFGVVYHVVAARPLDIDLYHNGTLITLALNRLEELAPAQGRLVGHAGQARIREEHMGIPLCVLHRRDRIPHPCSALSFTHVLSTR